MFYHCDEIIYNTLQTIQSAKPVVRQMPTIFFYTMDNPCFFFSPKERLNPNSRPLGIKRPFTKDSIMQKSADPSIIHHQSASSSDSTLSHPPS